MAFISGAKSLRIDFVQADRRVGGQVLRGRGLLFAPAVVSTTHGRRPIARRWNVLGFDVFSSAE